MRNEANVYKMILNIYWTLHCWRKLTAYLHTHANICCMLIRNESPHKGMKRPFPKSVKSVSEGMKVILANKHFSWLFYLSKSTQLLICRRVWKFTASHKTKLVMSQFWSALEFCKYCSPHINVSNELSSQNQVTDTFEVHLLKRAFCFFGWAVA